MKKVSLSIALIFCICLAVLLSPIIYAQSNEVYKFEQTDISYNKINEINSDQYLKSYKVLSNSDIIYGLSLQDQTTIYSCDYKAVDILSLQGNGLVALKTTDNTYKLGNLKGQILSNGFSNISTMFNEDTNPLFAVQKDGAWGFTDLTGGIVINYNYSRVYDFSEGLAGVGNPSNYSKCDYFIDRHGNATLSDVLKNYKQTSSSFHNGLLAVKNGEDKWGYINTSGTEAIPCQFYSAEDFKNGNAVVLCQPSPENQVNINGMVFTNNQGLIDKTGETIVPLNYSGITPLMDSINRAPTSNMYIVTKNDLNSGSSGLSGVVDAQGQTLLNVEYQGIDYYKIGSSDEDRILAIKNGKYSLLNGNFSFITDLNYDSVCIGDTTYSDHYICAQKGNKFGVLDRNGNIVIPFEYDQVQDFYQGYAIAKKNNKFGIIDIHNNVSVDFIYDSLTSGVIVPNDVKFYSAEINDVGEVYSRNNRHWLIDEKGYKLSDIIGGVRKGDFCYIPYYYSVDIALYQSDDSCFYHLVSGAPVVKPEPQMSLDSPAPNKSYTNEGISISGWAVNASGISRVDIWLLDGGSGTRPLGSVSDLASRPDVVAAVDPNHHYKGSDKSGFDISVPSASLTSGSHLIGVAAIGNDGSIQWSTRTISVVKPEPQMCLDSPAPNKSYTDESISISGWALNASGISRVDIWLLDGGSGTRPLGSVPDLASRPDVVAAVDPNHHYKGSDKSGFGISISSDSLTSGSHLIGVAAIGNDGSVQWSTRTISVR